MIRPQSVKQRRVPWSHIHNLPARSMFRRSGSIDDAHCSEFLALGSLRPGAAAQVVHHHVGYPSLLGHPARQAGAAAVPARRPAAPPRLTWAPRLLLPPRRDLEALVPRCRPWHSPRLPTTGAATAACSSSSRARGEPMQPLVAREGEMNVARSPRACRMREL
jgi:hypothetical protein